MDDTLASSQDKLCEILVSEFRELPIDTIWLVEKEGRAITVIPAKPSDFREWLRVHQGFFSKFPRQFSDWTKGDRFRSSKILGDHRSTFYAQVLVEDIKTYPPS